MSLSNLSCSEDADDDVAQCCRMKACARAVQRRSGGENSAALVFRHQQVTDVPLTAGRAHLEGGDKKNVPAGCGH